MKKTMFYLFLFIDVVLLSLFICAPYSMASEIIDTDTIYWDWHGPTPENSGLPSSDPIANDLKFNLYMSDQSGVYDIGNPDAEITYTQSTGDPYTYEFNLTVTGNGTVTRYFVLTAWYDGEESGMSNEVSKVITIPKDIPLHLRFTITVEQ